MLESTKDQGCIQEIYLTKLKINILNTTYLKFIFFIQGGSFNESNAT